MGFLILLFVWVVAVPSKGYAYSSAEFQDKQNAVLLHMKTLVQKKISRNLLLMRLILFIANPLCCCHERSYGTCFGHSKTRFNISVESSVDGVNWTRLECGEDKNI